MSSVVAAVPTATPGRPRRRGAAPRLRLTARGRRLLAALGIAAATAVVTSVAGLGGGTASLHLEGQSSVVVRPGDTLWSIASTVARTDDVRDVVDRIQQLNGLHGTVLQPGQVLRLP